MRGMNLNWIRDQLSNRRITQSELAAGIGLTPIQLNKVLTGYRVLQSVEADNIRRFFGYRLPEDPKPIVAVAGRVGAGALVPLVDAYEKGDGLYHVALPHGLPNTGVVAVEIKGDSMTPVYDDGDLLFYSREYETVDSNGINRNCICCDIDGNVWVKRIKLGSERGLYNLVSINPNAENQHDVELRWAAPVLLHLPKSLVENLTTEY